MHQEADRCVRNFQALVKEIRILSQDIGGPSWGWSLSWKMGSSQVKETGVETNRKQRLHTQEEVNQK